MDLTNLNTIKKITRAYGLHPNRSNGQNFLIDKNILDKIVKAGELSLEDRVLEIGPGFGVLTQELVATGARVIAVERDKRLNEFLNKEIKGKNNLEIINNDILKINLEKINQIPAFAGMTSAYKIISNLPYQITAPILWKFLHEEKAKPSLLVLLVQKEVGQRICAKAGQMSVLAVLCQLYADCELLAPVSRNCFWPVPEVDSVIVKLRVCDQSRFVHSSLLTGVSMHCASSQETWRQHSKGEGGDNKELLRLVKIGFSAKRKMLKNNLTSALSMPAEKVVAALRFVGLDEKVRAQELRVEEWIELYRNLKF